MALAINEPILTPEQIEAYQNAAKTEYPKSMKEAFKEAGAAFLSPRPTEEKYNQILEELKELKGKSWKDCTKEQKEALCTFQSGMFGLHRRPGEKVRRQPRYCGTCPKCLAKQAKEREEKFRKARTKAQLANPENTKWQKKTVPKNSAERESLKKHINRNHDKMHMEVPNKEDDDMIDIWTCSDGSDSKLGEEANPNEIDWDAVNRKCKDGDSKVSFGGGMRPDNEAPKEDTHRFLIPEVIVARKDTVKATEIINDTNVLEQAETVDELQDILIRQFIMAVENLQKANIEIYAIYDQYLNLSIEKSLNDHNEFVRKCSYIHNNIIEPNTDKVLPKQSQDFQEYNLDNHDWLEGNE